MEELCGQLLLAVNFAAEKHKNQRRKNAEQTPYINHPLRVAQYLAEAGIEDVEIWIGAILHDTVEDTDTTLDEIESLFGKRTRNMVDEVTDNKTLPKAIRKRLQISHTADISDDAKCIKMADKLHNLSSFQESVPKGWDVERIQGYFVWAKAVVENCKGINSYLEGQLDTLFNEGVFSLTEINYPGISNDPEGKLMFDQGAFSLERIEYPCIPSDTDLKEFLEDYLQSMETIDD